MTTERIAPRDCLADINGLKLHYLDWGREGLPPMVLLHGFSAHAHYWDGFAAKMRDNFHVYALDQRGHGDSEWATDYGPETMPADFASFVDQLGLDRFVLLGHSMGGGVAFRYAASHPERIENLIIVDSSLPSPDRPAVPNRHNSVQRSLASGASARSFPSGSAVSTTVAIHSSSIPHCGTGSALGSTSSNFESRPPNCDWP